MFAKMILWTNYKWIAKSPSERARLSSYTVLSGHCWVSADTFISLLSQCRHHSCHCWAIVDIIHVQYEYEASFKPCSFRRRICAMSNLSKVFMNMLFDLGVTNHNFSTQTRTFVESMLTIWCSGVNTVRMNHIFIHKQVNKIKQTTLFYGHRGKDR